MAADGNWLSSTSIIFSSIVIPTYFELPPFADTDVVKEAHHTTTQTPGASTSAYTAGTAVLNAGTSKAESAPKPTQGVRIEDATAETAVLDPKASKAESAPKATPRVHIGDVPEGSANGTFAAHRARIKDATTGTTVVNAEAFKDQRVCIGNVMQVAACIANGTFALPSGTSPMCTLGVAFGALPVTNAAAGVLTETGVERKHAPVSLRINIPERRFIMKTPLEQLRGDIIPSKPAGVITKEGTASDALSVTNGTLSTVQKVLINCHGIAFANVTRAHCCLNVYDVCCGWQSYRAHNFRSSHLNNGERI